MKNRPTYLMLATLLLVPRATHSQWQPGGVAICIEDSIQSSAVACPDGSGGVIVAWTDARSFALDKWSLDVYAQRVSAAGFPLWTSNGVVICASHRAEHPRIVSDGAGGAVIVWPDYRYGDGDIFAQRVDATGAVQWTSNGVALTSGYAGQFWPAPAPDGTGGAIVAFSDSRTGHTDVYAQRIDGSGTVLWAASGVPLCDLPLDQGASGPLIISDGAGGAIATWEDYRVVLNQFDIYAQRVAPGGEVYWAVNGIPVCNALGNQQVPAIASDGGVGAIVAWSDYRNGLTDIYAQRLSGGGAAQWTPNGVAVCVATGGQLFPAVAKDGSGGAIIAWYDERSGYADIFAQRVNVSGAVQWTTDGNAICSAADNQYGARITEDGTGGAIIAWSDYRSGNYDIYAQRVAGSGVVQWALDGVALETDPGDQWVAAVIEDDNGGVVATYIDQIVDNDDIYAYHIGADGEISTGIGGAIPPSLSIVVGNSYPNPFASRTFVDVTLGRESAVSAEVFDAAGRRVRAIDIGRLQSGTSRLAFDGRDGRGRPLPSGVYFYRVRAGNESVTKKLVIAR